MRWGTYFAVTAAVVIVGLALGVTLPLVSLRLESWGYGPFAIGVMVRCRPSACCSGRA